MTGRHLIYIADPMCSWCWGFAPVIEAVQEHFSARLPLRLLLGGLAVGTTKVLKEAGKQDIRHHWEHVAELTGQPFDFDFFEREGFVYDTEPACRAVVAARRLRPDRALAFLSHLHRAFYTKNQHVTEQATLVDLAAEFGFERRQFELVSSAAETVEETRADFQTTRRFGIDGYPTLLAGDGEGSYSIMTLGYQPQAKVEGMIAAWLAWQDDRAAGIAVT